MSDLTVWRKAHDLLVEKGWTTGRAVNDNGCMCVGGAIAAAVTGNPMDMETACDSNPELDALLHKFADHVGQSRTSEWDDEAYDLDSYDRVYYWNDRLRYDENLPLAPEETVLKALLELDELESAK